MPIVTCSQFNGWSMRVWVSLSGIGLSIWSGATGPEVVRLCDFGKDRQEDEVMG